MLGRATITSSDDAWMSRGGSDALAFLRQLAFTVAVGAVMLFIVPNFISEFRQNLLAKLLTYAILAIGLDLVWGYGGMLSLGQGVFFGIGGFALGVHPKLLAPGGGLPPFLTLGGGHELPWVWETFFTAYVAGVVAAVGPGF